jgi:WD40 repeat protein
VISSDNHWLFSGSSDGTALLWSLTSKDPTASLVVLAGPRQADHCGGISPDNHWLVTGSLDGTVRLLDLTAKDPAASPVVLHGHKDAVNIVGISPDSQWLVTGSQDHTTRLWPLQVRDLIELARVTVGRNFTAEERKLYFPGEKYRKTFDELPGPDESVTPKKR